MKNDRDESIDRLLPGTLNARAAAEPDGACLDAETLAAWADDTLDRDARAAAEAHAADCARCQAMLAAMVKTAPAPAAARSPWRLPALGWLIPATAAAAALLVWTMVPERAPRQQTDHGAATDQLTAAAPADKPATREIEVEPPARVSAPAARRDASGANPGEQSGGGATADNRTLGRNQATNEAKNEAKQEANKEEPALKKDAPAAPAANALANPLADAASRAREASPASPLAAPAPPPQQRPAAAGAPVTSAAAAKSFAMAAAAPATVIVSSNPGSRWRIVPGGAVQHTVDGGSTWQTQQTGSTVTLAAGAAPSPSVCWLVGPDGIVLLSSDGRSWRRVSFPETADLVAVTATDDRTATVTFADGRTLSTTDGGVSWRR